MESSPEKGEYKEMSVDTSSWANNTNLVIDVPTPTSARKLFSESPSLDFASLRVASPGFFSPVNSRGASPCPLDPLTPSPWLSPPKVMRSTSDLTSCVIRSKFKRTSPPTVATPPTSPPPVLGGFFQEGDSPVVRPRPLRLSENSKYTQHMRRLKSDGRARPYPVGSRSAITPSRPLEELFDSEEFSPSPTPKLPRIASDLCGVNVISAETCAELIRGEHGQRFDTVIVIDCRFDYEYKGGHIRGAVNVLTREDVDRLFFRNPHVTGGDRVAIVFHCEFSKHRGPKMCKSVRERDRKIHGLKHFPKLFYPEMYVLEGGYKNFYAKFSELCDPNGYVSMKDPRFLDAQKVCWKLWKTAKNTKKELARSRSLSDLRSPPDQTRRLSEHPVLSLPPTPTSKRPLVTSFSMTTLHLQTPLEPRSHWSHNLND